MQSPRRRVGKRIIGIKIMAKSKKTKPLPIDKILQQQGFGTRAYCRALIETGEILVNHEVCDDPDELFDLDGLSWQIDGQTWHYREHVYLLMNKPANYECSQKPQHHMSVLSLLPIQLRNRDVQCVGRLDVDTTGLLLISDDGQFIHKNTSPKKNVDKVYHATCRHPLTDEMLHALTTGVLLHDENETLKAISARVLDAQQPNVLELVLREGKYHQVKRMVAAAGNRVDELHRVRVGEFELPNDLPIGEWIYLD